MPVNGAAGVPETGPDVPGIEGQPGTRTPEDVAALADVAAAQDMPGYAYSRQADAARQGSPYPAIGGGYGARQLALRQQYQAETGKPWPDLSAAAHRAANGEWMAKSSMDPWSDDPRGWVDVNPYGGF